jgi:RimJ/RimL family protein N-acetyltransferase
VDERAIQERVTRQLAADYACEVDQLSGDGVSLVESRRLPGRRRFPWREKRLGLVTMGRGVVICCDAGRLNWARTHLADLERDGLFAAANVTRLQDYVRADGQYMDGPVLKFTCAPGRLREGLAAGGLSYELFEGDRVERLYPHREFSNALGLGRDPARPDVLACAARHDGRVVGLAGASADSDELWQIGVDVAPEYRERGVARDLVCRVTRAILERGRVPYYSTYASNLASIRVAASVGFSLSWLELEARDPRRERPRTGRSAGSRPEVGLCLECRHGRRVESGRSTFWQCLRARTDAAFRRYPELPVEHCQGFEPA